MRKIFILIILIINFSSVAFAECNFQLINFGDSKKKLNEKINSILNIDEEFPLMLMPDKFGGEVALIPSFEICPDEEKLHGTMAEYLFINDKLERIELVRAFMQDRNLMEYSMNKYGEFNLPEGLPVMDWRGNHFWENNSEAIEYLVFKKIEGAIEMISIHRLKPNNAVNTYYEKVGKWLDKQ
jgi:hypothetical protein